MLGKHVPQSPSVVYGYGFALGRRVRELLGTEDARAAVVLGYAETATGLGHCVADGVGLAPYLHSTRRPVPGVTPAGGFEESHSHATSHLLLPQDPGLLAGAARWSWSTTSSRPATRSSTPSVTCTPAIRASGT